MEYSVIFNGNEDFIEQQVGRVNDIARSAGGRILQWKKKSVQERVCQFIGKPSNSKWVKADKLKRKGLATKYALFRIDSERFENIKKQFGSTFEHVETVDTDTYNHVDFLKYMALDASTLENMNFKKWATKEEIDADVAERAKELGAVARYTENPLYVWDDERNRHEVGIKYRVEFVKTHTVKLDPWVVLDEDGMAAAQKELETLVIGESMDDLRKLESKYIDDYNNALGIYRKRRLEQDATQEQKDAWDAREEADIKLKETRATIGRAKRSMTTAMKKQGGIDIDLTQYSCV